MFRQAFRSPLTAVLRASTSSTTSTFKRIPRVHPAFVRLLSQDARAQIQKAVTSHPLVVFMKGTPEEPQCGFSRAVVQILGIHGVPLEKMKSYNVLEDSELRTGIKEFSEWPTIPQVYVGGEFVGGCDIVMGMHQSGELEDLLEKHEIIPKLEEEPQPSSQPTSSS